MKSEKSTTKMKTQETVHPQSTSNATKFKLSSRETNRILEMQPYTISHKLHIQSICELWTRDVKTVFFWKTGFKPVFGLTNLHKKYIIIYIYYYMT